MKVEYSFYIPSIVIPKLSSCTVCRHVMRYVRIQPGCIGIVTQERASAMQSGVIVVRGTGFNILSAEIA